MTASDGRDWLIVGGRIIDPASGLDRIGDLAVVDGRVLGIVGHSCDTPTGDLPRIEATGQIVAPGLIDLNAHLRQPGAEDVETIHTGTRAAARGGFTTVCCAANTDPPIDSRGQLDYVGAVARRDALVRVRSYGAVTLGRAGQELAELGELAEAGAVAFSDEPSPIASGRLMRHALEYAGMLDRPIVAYCEDPDLSRGGAMHDGAVAAMLGLRGIPAAGEEAIVARDVALCELADGRLHICHVSTAGAVETIRRARARGVRVTADVTPHHLVATEEWVAGQRWQGRARPYDARTKVRPPLRTERDRRALVAGLADGTIDAIATDHAPRASTEKDCEFDAAAFGILGFETALGLVLRLVEAGEIDLTLALAALTARPAAAFGLPGGSLEPGAPADAVIVNTNTRRTFEAGDIRSMSANSPFIGQPLVGDVTATLCDGRLVFGSAASRAGGR